MTFLKPSESVVELGNQYNLNIREKLMVLNITSKEDKHYKLSGRGN
jgi:hypothetical protein